MENTEGDLMSAIQFQTTPKDDLPNYSYILSNLELLGMELKNEAYYRLGTVLSYEYKKGGGGNTLEFQWLGTTACMKRLTRGKKGCGQM